MSSCERQSVRWLRWRTRALPSLCAGVRYRTCMRAQLCSKQASSARVLHLYTNPKWSNLNERLLLLLLLVLLCAAAELCCALQTVDVVVVADGLLFYMRTICQRRARAHQQWRITFIYIHIPYMFTWRLSFSHAHSLNSHISISNIHKQRTHTHTRAFADRLRIGHMNTFYVN